MATIDTACQALIGAVYKDAFDIVDQIVQELRAEGVEPSLDDPVCRDVFAQDWFVARLAYLHIAARDIRDHELRKRFREEIQASVAEVQETIHDAKDCFNQYCLLALNYFDGIRDSFGLLPSPGPFLSKRYSGHVPQIRAGGHSRKVNLQTTEVEEMLIMAVGDGACWTWNGKLDDTLSSMLRM